MRPVLYRCPNSGYRVQGWFEENSPDDVAENVYRAVTCLFCQQVHLVNPATGKVLGAAEEPAALT